MQVQRLRADETALLIVDVQEPLVQAMSEAERLVDRCLLLARAAAELGLPVAVTEHNPSRLGATVPSLLELVSVQPLSKMLFSACTPELTEALHAMARSTILLCGVESHVCAMQTVLDLRDQGYQVFVAGDAVASRQEQDKRVGLERMRLAGAVVTSAESAVFELMRQAGTPQFKAMLPYLK